MNFVLILGILLVFGLASTRLMRILKLPNVTGFLLVGLLIAVACVLLDNFFQLNLSNELSSLNSGVSSVALGFIALSIGEEFRISKIKKLGGKILLITFLQAILTFVLVGVGVILLCHFLSLPIEIGICLSAIAMATAPAATLMVIHQYKAKGPLVDILLPVVALDDAIGLIFFSISISISKVLATGASFDITSLVVFPLIEIFGSLTIGVILGFIMKLAIHFFKSRNNHVAMIIAFTLLGVGICELLSSISIGTEKLQLSSLLTCMMIGATYENFGEDIEIVERDFTLVERWTPAIFMLFFVLSGTHLVTSFKEILSTDVNLMFVLIIFIAYIVMRCLGKYFGSFIGCKITKREKNITNYLGITLFPQAGVAIGMANTISNMEAFKGNTGNIIVTVVLCATLLYELVGPLLTKWSLSKAGEIPIINELSR